MITTVTIWPDEEDFESGLNLELRRVENEENILFSFKDNNDQHIFQSFEFDLKQLKAAILKLEVSYE